MKRSLLGSILIGGFLALLLSNPEIATAQKGGNSGTISKVDPKAGSITINMLVVAKKKKEQTDKEFLLAPDAKVTIVEGGQKKTMTGKEALADNAIKQGAIATFVAEGDLKIKELTIGEAAKTK